ncbi:MAG: hypothetical protein AB1384_11075 [Actinomycetota bacterium]
MSTVYHVLVCLAIAYYLVLYTMHMLHLAVGYRAIMRWKKMGYVEEAHRLSRSGMVPPLTLVAEIDSTGEDTMHWIDRNLSQRYPEMEVLVVYGRSDDERAERIIHTFFLRRVDRVYRRVLEAPQAVEVYQSDDHRLTLVRTDGEPGADCLNLALNLARYPIFGVADRAALLEEDALLCMVRPFMEGEVSAPAVMGVELPSDMEGEGHLPPRRITRFALMDSLRIQLGFLAGAPYLGGPATAYGSLTLYRKGELLAAGGFQAGLSQVEAKMEMTLRLQRIMHEQGRLYRFAYVPQVVVRRDFPRNLGECVNEFRERQAGIQVALRSGRGTFFKTGYGHLGFVQLPSFWLFVKLAPLIGFVAFTLSIVFFALGLVGWPVFAGFLASSMLYPALVGVGAVAVARRGLGILKGQGAALFGYAFLTQFWYRQLMGLAPLFSPAPRRPREVE